MKNELKPVVIRKTLMKFSSDDWYPSYDDGMVEVGLVSLFPVDEHPRFRVWIWGADDCGMERDFHTKEEAEIVFENICKMDDVTRKALKTIGFYSA